MPSVDSRIVDMQFNNKQFESGIQTSVKSLENLKNGLGSLENSGNNLKTLQGIANSFSLAHMAAGIEDLKKKFSTLSIVGITAITNLANEAVNAGQRMISAFTIDPIKTGFNEYETKMNAIQTIMTNTASKGTTMSDVTAALEELNVYADKTIYNFAEMTRNIGTFTAAGVDLDTATMSIKGIANLAAGSGSNAMQASTAMYQLSQALAAGKVSLMDWNSVVNAGMGGELFQKALEKTAVELGHGRDMSKSFRESLQDGWITTEVLTKTLKKFADDPALLQAATQIKTFTQMIDTMKESVQSGWAQSWETIIGNKDEAAKFFTAINDAFGKIVGGSSEARNKMLKDWKELGGRDALIQGLANAAQALGAVLKPIIEAFKEIFPPMTGARLAEATKRFKDFTVNLKIGEATTANIKAAFKGLFSVLSIIGQVAFTVVKAIAALFGVMVPTAGGVLGLAGALGTYLTGVNQTIKASGVLNGVLDTFKKTIAPIPTIFSNLYNWLCKLPPILYDFGVKAKNAFAAFGGGMSKLFSNFNFDQLFTVVNGTLLAGVLMTLKKFIGGLKVFAKDPSGIVASIKSILSGVGDSLSAFQDQMKSGQLIKIAGAIGILAVSLFLLASIDPNRLAGALAGITVLFGELFGSLTLFQKAIGGVGLKSLGTLTFGLLGISVAVLVLSVAMKNLADLDWKNVAVGLSSIGGLMVILVSAAKILSANSGALIKGSLGFIAFALALSILTNALVKIANLSPDAMAKGLLGLQTVILELMVFMKNTDFKGMALRSGTSLMLIAVAINLLADAVSKFGNMDTTALLQGLAALGMVLLEIMTFAVVVGDTKMLISTAVSLTVLSVALNILAGAVGNMGGLPMINIAKGLGTMAASLIIMGIAMRYMKGSLAGAGALFIMAAALSVLAPVIKTLGGMSIDQITKSLLALTGVFVVLGGAATFLGPLVPALLGIGASILLISAGGLLAGAALLIIAAGLTAVGIALSALAVSIAFVVTTLISLIPVIFQGLLDAVNGFCTLITISTPLVINAIMVMLNGILAALVAFVPIVTQAGCTMILSFLYGITANIPFLVTAATDCIVTFINSISANLNRVIEAGVNLIVSFINGLANAIRNNTDTLVVAIQNLMNAVAEAAFKVLRGTAGTFFQIGGNAIQGFINGIKNGIASVGKAAAEMAAKALSSAKAALDSHSPSREFETLGMYSSQGMANGLVKYTGLVATAASNMGKGAISAMSASISGISDILNSDVNLNPTIRPVLDMTDVSNGIDSTFGQQQTLSLATATAKTSSIATSQNRSNVVAPTEVVNPAAPTTNITNIVNNPKKEVAEDSLRKTMLRLSYNM